MIYHPPEITKSDLPLKSSVRFTPPNCQVRFTLKSPSPIYPSNRLYDLPPPKSPSPIYPQIAKSDLPPQIVCMIYPPKSNLPLKSSVRFTPPKIAKSDLPSNRQVRFTPSNYLYDLPPPKSPSPIYPQIAKSDLPPQIVCTIYPPPNCQVQFTLKLPSPIYPLKLSV